MGVEVNGVNEVISAIREGVEEVVSEVIEGFVSIGERVVGGVVSGELSSWNDQTGNLRSSVGYIVIRDGDVKAEGGFQSYGEADEGPSRGRAYARSLISRYPTGVALIIVAGMEYAAYVEAMDNKTVLAQGELETARLVNELVERLNRRYS